MAMSMHDAAAPAFLQGLRGLSRVLAKGEAFAAEKGLDPLSLTSARLAPDMFPLTRQVQIATDHAKGAMHRLAGLEPPRWEDSETSFAELIGRVGRTIDVVAGFRPEQIDGSEERRFQMKVGPTMMDFVGQPYLVGFALPNFWFHVTTAYAILRVNGAPVGKRDYLDA